MLALLAVVATAWTGPVSLQLKDLKGTTVRPLEQLRKPATVFLFIGRDCPISNAYAPEINRIYKAYGGKGVRFYSVYEDSGLSLGDAREHAKEFGYLFDGLLDGSHDLATKLAVDVTPEATVLDADGNVFYRGRIDNTYASVGVRRTVTTKRDLRDALDAVLTGKPAPKRFTSAVGCFIPKRS
ncbi:MAG TPA: redoxin family protein [Fimbriimonas sp.]|nr:redoxin family protein [Fimbriimonas sp.]